METNPHIPLSDLVNLANYRKKHRMGQGLPDPLIILVAYAQDELIYDNGRITTCDATNYERHKHSPEPASRNILVNKFGQCYPRGWPLLLHRRLADVIIDTAIDMQSRFRHFTVVMDGLRTYEAGQRMQANRPDLVASGMLAPAGASAHNRALAVDSKLFELIDPQSYETWVGEVPLTSLEEADEHGHLDDEQDMHINSRFYAGPMSTSARKNRHERIVCWQRASVKNRTPIANLLAEFWDDRVPGSPSDMWRVLVCRAMCLHLNVHPSSHPEIQKTKAALSALHETHTAGHLTRAQFLQHAHA
ncbi:MAG: hypothetical protein K2Q01_04225, partial [Rickettsiales bacterium]|nr:hypothetical protein [Rickettsiales bacterium]